MSEFQQQALKLAGQQQSPGWLVGLRQRSADQWQNAAWPTRKTEAWRYTSLMPLESGRFEEWALPVEASEALKQQLLEIDAYRVVLVNGVFDPALSTELPASLVRFSDADAACQALIEEHLGRVADQEKHLFAALNSAWTSDGFLLHLNKGQVLDKPLYIVHLSLPGESAAVANQRVLTVLEANSSARMIEHYVTADGQQQNGFVNSITEAVVGDNAQLEHYRLNLEDETLLHVGGVHINLMASARFNGFTIAQGSRLKRIDYQIRHLGQGAELDLKGVYLPRNNQRVDYHTNVEHCVPHCTTNEVFRGVIGDSAKAVFNGRIHIHPHAQKTLAEMSNRNLLTSLKAEVFTKPELEIYADDVKCAHGATVSQLDDGALFYMTSRGISEEEARVMLSFGFVNELIESLSEETVKSYLRPRLAQLFGQDEKLTRHIIHE
ncbi:Fe-S cluster assembly protein SufD [Nitrincola sp. MINF-07-Sa-05]|uniref:Fe-S cluster assembly protein SufD n=1 Tax=Nitrincola salilacus TaxID=3400273 RepID=UPI003917F951